MLGFVRKLFSLLSYFTSLLNSSSKDYFYFYLIVSVAFLIMSVDEREKRKIEATELLNRNVDGTSQTDCIPVIPAVCESSLFEFCTTPDRPSSPLYLCRDGTLHSMKSCFVNSCNPVSQTRDPVDTENEGCTGDTPKANENDHNKPPSTMVQIGLTINDSDENMDNRENPNTAGQERNTAGESSKSVQQTERGDQTEEPPQTRKRGRPKNGTESGPSKKSKHNVDRFYSGSLNNIASFSRRKK